MRRETKHSQNVLLRAVRTIKYCAMLLIGFAVVGMVYLSVAVRGQDDIAGGVALCVFIDVRLDRRRHRRGGV